MVGQFDILKKQIERGLVPHAYLFSGSDEGGKQKAIKYLISDILGDNYMSSPDFYKIDSTPISIKEIRGLRERASRTPLGGTQNVFLIYHIDALHWDAAPVLLKTIEEPVAHNMFIATTNNVSAIHSTLVSRFSHLRFWRGRQEAESDSGLEAIRNLSFAKRFSKASDIAKKASLEPLVKSALQYFELSLKSDLSNTCITRLERLLRVQKALGDPTINKKLLTEYFMMII
jgi:DNA polymerase III delta prime subunit